MGDGREGKGTGDASGQLRVDLAGDGAGDAAGDVVKVFVFDWEVGSKPRRTPA